MSQQDRLIFPYHDGEAERFADPIHIQRQLRLLCGCDPNDLVKTITKGFPADCSPVTQEAFEAAALAESRLHDVIRRAFNMKPFAGDGTGCTTADVQALWAAWCEWLQKKSPTPENSRTCSASMAPSS